MPVKLPVNHAVPRVNTYSLASVGLALYPEEKAFILSEYTIGKNDRILPLEPMRNALKTSILLESIRQKTAICQQIAGTLTRTPAGGHKAANKQVQRINGPSSRLVKFLPGNRQRKEERPCQT